MSTAIASCGPLPAPRAYRHDPSVWLAQCALGLTLYTRHRPPEPGTGAARMLSMFLEYAPRERLRWMRTSLRNHWVALRERELEMLVEELGARGLDGSPRHLFELHVADRTDAPQVFFSHREVDEARGAGAGYIQLGLRPEDSAGDLFQLAMEACHHVPHWWGTAGYLVAMNPFDPCSAASAAWRWAKRYWGVDVQQPDRQRIRAPLGPSSVNWLTLLGRGLLDRAPEAREEIGADAVRNDASWLEGREGGLLRAGPSPTLADMNWMESCSSYASAHHVLRDFIAPAGRGVYGGFWEADALSAWGRRFTEPEGWVR